MPGGLMGLILYGKYIERIEKYNPINLDINIK